MISVVIPLYNKEKTVARAIRSVLAQTFQDFEVVVVNDGSTDNGPQIVAGIGDPRIKFVNQSNVGVAAARNRGVAESRSEVVAFLDADDEWLPEFLEAIQRLQADFRECMVFATGYEIVSPLGIVCGLVLRGMDLPSGRGVLTQYFRVAAESDPPLSASSVAVKKTAITAVGGFPSGIKSGEDLLVWARLAARFQIAYDLRCLARFYEPESVKDRPGRLEANGDKVLKQLFQLWESVSSSQNDAFRRYVGHWLAMRASIMLQSGRGWDACVCAVRAMKYRGIEIKLLGFIFLGLLPSPVREKLFVILRTNRKWSS